MRREDWNKGLGEIDPELVEEYIEQKAKYAKKSGRRPLIRAVIVAACVCLVIAAVVALPIALRYGSKRWLNIPDESTGESDGNGYDGPDGSTGETMGDGYNSATRDEQYVSSYELKTVGDQLYMVFNSYDVPPGNTEATDGNYGVTFDSIEDFQRGVIKDKTYGSVYEGEGFRELSFAEMDYIVQNFERDENGIPIVDMYNLYLPDMPEGWELGWGEDYPVVDWRDGDEYVVYVSNPSENKRATFLMLYDEDYYAQRENAEQVYGEPVLIDTDGKHMYLFDHTSSSGKNTITVYAGERLALEYHQYVYTIYGEETSPENDYLLQFGISRQYASEYILRYIGDQWYIIFDSYGRYPESDFFMHFDCIEGVAWESMDSLIAVINATNYQYASETQDPSQVREFTLEEMDMMLWNFTRDEIGIPVFDADNPYVPKMPDGWSVSMLEWRDGCEYIMFLDEDLLSSLHVMPNGAMTAQGLAAESGRLITDDDRTVLINISQDNNLYNVEMKVVEDEICYVYNLCGFDEMPSEEYLLSFGMRHRYASKYELEYVYGQLYMVFDSNDLGGGSYWFSQGILSPSKTSFDTVEEFIETVTNTASNRDEAKPYFEKWELMRLLTEFTRDEIGIPIVDVYDLPMPDAPVDYTIKRVHWTDGTGLYFEMDSETIKSFRILSQEEWEFFEMDFGGKEKVENGERTVYFFSSDTLLIRQGDVCCKYEFYKPYAKEDALLFGVKP